MMLSYFMFRQERMASELGATVVKDLSQYGKISHFIAPSLLRTTKLMAAASLRPSSWPQPC